MAQATDSLSPIEMTDQLEAARPTRQTAVKRNSVKPNWLKGYEQF